ncbi:helix-turn-helix domain-containing protein [bacterium]|nr:helix-turn-helix domain-containing protein [bacterium]
MDKYLTTEQASEKLGVTPRTVQYWCKIQKIPGAIKMSRKWVINERLLFKWLKEQEQRLNPIWIVPKYQKV